MGHPILEQEKAEAAQRSVLKRKRRSFRTNDQPNPKPANAKRPDSLRGKPPAHAECDEDRGNEMPVGHE